MPKVEFEREGVVVEARAGQTLLEIADAAGIELFRGIWPELHCRRRHGWCNRCKIWIATDSPDAVNPPTAHERTQLRLNGRIQGAMRLACQVALRGDVRVHTRAGGPVAPPSLAARAPDWNHALSKRPFTSEAAASAPVVLAGDAAPPKNVATATDADAASPKSVAAASEVAPPKKDVAG